MEIKLAILGGVVTLNRESEWISAGGKKERIMDMTDTHLVNMAIYLQERRAKLPPLMEYDTALRTIVLEELSRRPKGNRLIVLAHLGKYIPYMKDEKWLTWDWTKGSVETDNLPEPVTVEEFLEDIGKLT